MKLRENVGLVKLLPVYGMAENLRCWSEEGDIILGFMPRTEQKYYYSIYVSCSSEIIRYRRDKPKFFRARPHPNGSRLDTCMYRMSSK